MPNIELHGYMSRVAMALREAIFKVFADQPFVGEMVVEIYPTQVFDAGSVAKPYVRLVNSCQDYTVELLEGLRSLEVEFGGIDIEHLKLQKFYPAEAKRL